MDTRFDTTVRIAGQRATRRWAERIAVRFVSCFLAVLTLADSGRAAQQPPRPPFEVVVGALQDHFQSQEDYRPGDLVTQSQIVAALESVRDAGWDVPDAERIVELAPADNSFLATQLGTPAGRKFMRKVARHSGAYIRLDRLSSLPRGKKLVRDLIAQRDGDKFIEYLATTTGGRNLGGMLANAKQGANLNAPTGRIYTADDLLAELQRVYAKSK